MALCLCQNRCVNVGEPVCVCGIWSMYIHLEAKKICRLLMSWNYLSNLDGIRPKLPAFGLINGVVARSECLLLER